ILIGVTFALLDFVEHYPMDFPELIIMETGGMKGRRKEMIREELHHTLCKGFGVDTIHSEYGMTELLSQAYSKGHGIFNCPPWMKVITRDTNDPISPLDNDKTGGINVIDLANINSCSFIATQDLGKVYADGSFEVLGRFDDSDIRGCNLLIA
ncbi:MAG: acyl transferase, partial [Mucilaginibacter sp.]